MLFLEAFEIEQKFKANDNQKLDWKLEGLHLNNNLNLIVGKNATGKSKTLFNIIKFASLIKTGEIRTFNSNTIVIKATFKELNPNIQNSTYKEYTYSLNILNEKTIIEELKAKTTDDTVIHFIKRDKDVCTIWNDDEKKDESIYPPDDTVVIAYKDRKKYPYLDEIRSWTQNINAYSFGEMENPNSWPTIQGLPIKEILKEIPENIDLQNKIKDNLNELNYFIQEIEFHVFAGRILTLFQEQGLDKLLFVESLSSGMQRTFYILMLLEYFLASKKNYTLLIDDIGEGLDFERSSKLTKILLEKSKNSNLQIIITSNDRYLMNVIDIEYWNLLTRQGSIVTAHNYHNGKDLFDEFKLIGLNNIDFFTDFDQDSITNDN